MIKKIKKLCFRTLYVIVLSFIGIQSYTDDQEIYSAECFKRSSAISLTTSMVVPCYYKHAVYLLDLLNFIKRHSTIMPDEVVIALSGIRKISPEIIEEIQSFQAPFCVKLLLFEQDKSEAENRNSVCNAAQGDIIIGQDADDLPHPQRIEIIKYFFEHYDIVHLLHGWACEASHFQHYADMREMSCVNIRSFKKCYPCGIRVANGPSSFRRFIMKELQFDEVVDAGSDFIFNVAVYSRYANTLIVPSEIYVYNAQRSSYQDFDTMKIIRERKISERSTAQQQKEAVVVKVLKNKQSKSYKVGMSRFKRRLMIKRKKKR